MKNSRTYVGSRQNTCSCLLACCRTQLSGRHDPFVVCTLRLCAGPTAGFLAVLAVRRYSGYRSLVCAFTYFAVCAQAAGSETNKKRGIDGNKKKKRGWLIFSPEKMSFPSAIKSWGWLRGGRICRGRHTECYLSKWF